MSRKLIEVKRLTQEEIKALAKDFFDKRWVVVTQKVVDDEPMVFLFLGALRKEYDIPEDTVLLVSYDIGARGYLNPREYKCVHAEDYNEAVKLLSKALEVLA